MPRSKYSAEEKLYEILDQLQQQIDSEENSYKKQGEKYFSNRHKINKEA